MLLNIINKLVTKKVYIIKLNLFNSKNVSGFLHITVTNLNVVSLTLSYYYIVKD